VINFLRSTEIRDVAIKITTVVLFFLLGLFVWTPFFIFCGALISLYIVFEYNVNSVVYLFFFISFEYYLREWFYLMYAVFVVVMIVKYIREVPNKKLYIALLIISAVYIIYNAAISRFNFAENFAILAANLVLLFLMVGLRDRVDFRRVTLFFVAGIFLTSVISLFDLATMIFYTGELLRFQALTGNPNRLNFHIILGIAALCSLALKKQIRTTEFNSLVAVLFGIGLATLSRNFLFAFPVVFGFYIIFKLIGEQKQAIKKIAVTIGCLILVCGAMFMYTSQHLSRMTDEPLFQLSSSDSVPLWGGTYYDPGRAQIWRYNLQDWSSSWDRVLFGRGLDTPLIINGHQLFHEHNIYIFVLARTGIVGVAIILLVAIALLYTLFKCARYRFSLSALLPLIALLSLGMFELVFPRLFSFLCIVLFVFALEKKDEILDKKENKVLE